MGSLWAFELAMGIALAAEGGSKEALLTPEMILLTTLSSFAAMSGAVWFFACWRYRLPIREGLALVRPGGRATLAAVGGGLALAILGIVLFDHFSTGRSLIVKIVNQPGGLAAMVSLLLLAPPFEELYYRGFLYPILERKIGRAWAALVVILWFAGVHVMQLAEDPVGLVSILGLSVLTTLLRSRTGSLVPAVLAHAVYNGALVASTLGGFP